MFKEIVDDGQRTSHDGHWAITKAHHEHFVLRTSAVGMTAMSPEGPISRNCDLKPVAGIR